MIDEFLGNKYKLHSSENFDEFMKALGIGLIFRKLANSISPVHSIQKEGDEYILTSAFIFKTITLRFKPGVEFEQETPDGRKIMSTFTIDGNTLREVQRNPDGSEAVIESTYSADEMKAVVTFGNITAIRIYKIQT